MPGESRKPVAESGLWRENAMWVKGLGGAVWFRRANLLPESRKPLVECGLGERICCLGQESRWWSVVCGEKTPRGSKDLVAECGLGGRTSCLGQESRWRSVVCGEKTPRGSKDLVVECGLWRENAMWVKGLGGGVWFR